MSVLKTVSVLELANLLCGLNFQRFTKMPREGNPSFQWKIKIR